MGKNGRPAHANLGHQLDREKIGDELRAEINEDQPPEFLEAHMELIHKNNKEQGSQIDNDGL